MWLLPSPSAPAGTDALQVSAGLPLRPLDGTFKDYLVPIGSSDSSSPTPLREGQNGLHLRGCSQTYQLQFLAFLFFMTAK